MQLFLSWGAKIKLSWSSSLIWYGAYCPVGHDAARYLFLFLQEKGQWTVT
mgnify:FL=1|jgi:hypothetical protein